MERKTALSTAAALTMTSAAAVSALFLTFDQGAGAQDEPVPVVTEYQVVTAEPDPAGTAPGTTIHEIEYVLPADTGSAMAAPHDYEDDDHDDYEEDDHDEHEEDDDDD